MCSRELPTYPEHQTIIKLIKEATGKAERIKGLT
jgi:hypothetical protein